jgi:hypothetical protein
MKIILKILNVVFFWHFNHFVFPKSKFAFAISTFQMGGGVKGS